MKKAAIGICFDLNGQILLIKRSDVPLWVLPGGGIEENETPETTVVRELYEETGLLVSVVRKVGEYTPKNWMTSHTYVFECKMSSDTKPHAGPEALDAQFFAFSKLPKDLFFLHKEWLLDALKNLQDPIIRPIDSISWKSIILFLMRHPILAIRYLIARAGLPINSSSTYHVTITNQEALQKPTKKREKP